MFWLETDLKGVSITRLGAEENEKGRTCTFMYAAYMRECPLPAVENAYCNTLALWTKPFVTRNSGLPHIGLWEPGVLYRLPQAALDALGEGDDLCAAPVRVEFSHTPYSGFAVDEYNRGSADGESASVSTVLHTASYTPCIVAPHDVLISWLRVLDDGLPTFSARIDEKGLALSWLEPLLCAVDVRVEHLPGLLDKPVKLIGEEVPRETA